MSAVAIYRDLWRQRRNELLGRWVSEVPPIIFTRVDVLPQVLAIIGVGTETDVAPRYSVEITVDDMIQAGALAR